ncbi:MAG: hypothetical protein ACIPMY_00090 [Rickettsia endosymbiont of Pentastiridius leporinus]
MNSIATKIWDFRKNSDTNLLSVSAQIEEIKEMLDILVVNKGFINMEDEDDEDEYYEDEEWIELSVMSSK